MTAQGKHRPQPRTDLVPFLVPYFWNLLRHAVSILEEKGYEVRACRVHMEDHGDKATVVLHLSPAPVKARQIGGPKRVYSKHVNYAGQGMGATHRRNIETLLTYVEGLPDVHHGNAEGPQDGPLAGH